jgi:flagellar biosynthesis/type III secretory pathway protein FliH
LFNPTLQPKTPIPWQEHALLDRSAVRETGFQAMDWDALPRVDYRAVQFRQLAVPEPAKVVDQPEQFVVDDYQQPARIEAEATTDLEPVLETEQSTDVSETSPTSIDESTVHEEAAMAESTPVDEESGDEWAVKPEFEPEAQAEITSSDHAMNSEVWQQACDEAYQRGLQEGLAQAKLQAQNELEAALAQAHANAKTELDNALENLRHSLEQRTEQDVGLLREVTQRLEACVENSAQFFEPLKRLAVHIAEQLVLAELNVSGSAIERLVQRCLDELNLHGTQSISVELNPQDKARLEDMAGDLLKQIQLLAVAGLQPGSVRVIVNDTQVEDLVQHRLEALAHALLGQPEPWREKSPFFKQPLSQRDSDVQDAVQPRALPDPGAEDVIDA